MSGRVSSRCVEASYCGGGLLGVGQGEIMGQRCERLDFLTIINFL